MVAYLIMKIGKFISELYETPASVLITNVSIVGVCAAIHLQSTAIGKLRSRVETLEAEREQSQDSTLTR